jgi:DNA-binding response OmpR family regulator
MIKNVLIVDDDDLFIDLLSRYCIINNYDFMTCKNGQEAWLLILDKNNKIDLIISDNNMPLMNGIELLIRVKNSVKKHVKNILFILCSGDYDVLDYDKRSQLADKCFKKPYQISELTEYIKSLEI